VNSFGCRVTVFRDTIFSAGWEQAANNAGLCFGTGRILGFAVGGLWPRFRSKRVSFAQTALRLYPRRRAICAALRPAAQSFLSSARSSASQPIEILYNECQLQASRHPNGWSGCISYFEVYPEVYHHPQEDLVFAKLKTRDPAAAAKVGDLAREHEKGAERLRRVAHAVDNVLAGVEVLRQTVDTIVRDFIVHERHHMIT